MQTIVIGAGISGLACAHHLHRLGVPVLLLEQADRVGGLIESVEKDGFLFELGPQNFLATDPLRDLIAALGLENELLEADPRAPRYILVGRELRRAPLAPPALLTTSLLRASTKLRLFAELLGRSRPPESDESVADFVRRKFGADLLENLVGPFVSGVYAGDPEKLSLRCAFPAVHEWEQAYGSVIRGAIRSRPPKDKPRPTLCSFRGGVATLVRALGASLGEMVRTGVAVEKVRRGRINGSSHFEVRVVCGGRAQTLTAGAVVLATDTRAAASILGELAEGFRTVLGRIAYAPVAVVAAGYRRQHVGHPLDGFGFLVPRKQGLRHLGTVWNSALFPGRTPEGMVSLASFAGGATDPDLVGLPEENIAAIVEGEVAGVMKISGSPVARVVRCYRHALPQYTLGHARTLATLSEHLARFPGLFLTGNYLEGPALGACALHAARTAQQVHRYWSASQERG